LTYNYINNYNSVVFSIYIDFQFNPVEKILNLEHFKANPLNEAKMLAFNKISNGCIKFLSREVKKVAKLCILFSEFKNKSDHQKT